MSEDWDQVAVDVGLGLLEAGFEAYIVKETRADGDEEFSAETPSAYPEQLCKAVFAKWSSKHIDGSIIKMTDQKILVNADGLTLTPALGDLFRIDTDYFRVVEPLIVLKPANIPVLYTLNLRGTTAP